MRTRPVLLEVDLLEVDLLEVDLLEVDPTAPALAWRRASQRSQARLADPIFHRGDSWGTRRRPSPAQQRRLSPARMAAEHGESEL
jgi:hypothetical protein